MVKKAIFIKILIISKINVKSQTKMFSTNIQSLKDESKWFLE